jgi:hypothetical protein
MMSMSMMGSMMQTDWRQEPTELLPNGIPGDAYLTMPTRSEPFASTVGPGESSMLNGYLGVVGPDELAMFKVFKEDTNMSQISGFMPTFDKLRVGQRTIYQMRLHLPQEAMVAQSLNDNRLPKDAPTVSMSNLPADFQKLLAERVELFKKSPLGSLGAMMGAARGNIKP